MTPYEMNLELISLREKLDRLTTAAKAAVEHEGDKVVVMRLRSALAENRMC